MTDATDTSDPGAADDQSADIRWFGVPVFGWAMLISLALHGLATAPFLIWRFAPAAPTFEAEWVEQFDDLEAIGHGASSGRWAKLDPPVSPPDVEPPTDDGPAKPAADPNSADPNSADTNSADTNSVDANSVDTEADKTSPPEAPKPAPDKPDPDKPSPKKPDNAPEATKKPAPKPTPTAEHAADKTTPRPARQPFAADKPLPGLDRQGPSDIPNLKHYGPGNARMTALVRLDRVRGTLYEEGVRRVMQAVPDFRILAHATGFDPIDDIDSFFMASAKPQYIQHTFLAVRHHKTQSQIKAVLDRRFRQPPPWHKINDYQVRRLVPADSGYQDPRQVMLARPGLTIVGKDRWLERIAKNLAADSPLRPPSGSDASDGHAKSPNPAPKANLLDGLAQIERAAADKNTLAIMSAQGLVYRIPGLGRMRFEGVRLKLANPKSPTIDVDLKFVDADHARKFARACPAMRARLKKAMGLTGGFASFATDAVGLGDVIDKLRCQSDKDYVNIHAVYRAQQVKTLANFAAPFMPKPRALRDLPPPPPRPALGGADAGRPDTSSVPDTSSAPDTSSGPDAGRRRPTKKRRPTGTPPIK